MREEKSVLEELAAEYAAEEARVLSQMTDDGVQTVGTANATVSRSEEDMPTVDAAHWEDVFKWIYDNGFFELFRKQLNAAPWRELIGLGEEIPHVTAFTKEKLSLRARRS
jgi:hypothetical protein